MSVSKSTATLKLNTGASIPSIGLGTWRADTGSEAYDSTLAALKAGYRHIDTAKIYGNEEEVGKAINDLGIQRSEIFVTTKLWNNEHKKAAAALDNSLKLLGLEYVDLYLIHWPLSTDDDDNELKDWNYIDTYKELQKLHKSGKAKAIGVSNFTITKLEKLLADSDVNVVPAVNQVESHVLLPQLELIEWAHKHKVVVEAYSPFGSQDAPILNLDIVKELADKYHITTGQVVTSWSVQRGIVVLPKSVKPERIEQNLQILQLADEDVAKLNEYAGKHGKKRLNEPFDVFSDE